LKIETSILIELIAIVNVIIGIIIQTIFCII